MISIGNGTLQMQFQSYLRKGLSAETQASERLSSGKRINRASDDAANLNISTRMYAQISGTNMGSRNIKDGMSLLQTAEAGLQSIAGMLQRMRELSLQADNGVYNAKDRAGMQQEIEQLKREIDQVAMNTQFNGRPLLGPSMEQIQASGAMADIVFVIDNTGSMSKLQEKVANNLLGFSQYLQSYGIRDVRFGVMEYTDSEKNSSSFPSGQWTTDATEVQTEVKRLATLNRGGTENVLGALTEMANQYTFRTNGTNTVGHAIVITDEKADDATQLPATTALLQGANIETHAIYDSAFDKDGVDDIGQVIRDTGGIGVDIQSDTWGDQLKSILAPKIMASATKDVPFDTTLTLHTGYEYDSVLDIPLSDNRTIALGIADVYIATTGDKKSQIEKIDAALEHVAAQLGQLGGYMNRLETIQENNDSSSLQATKTVSKIVDADMAKEISELLKAQVVQKTTIASMKQAQQTITQAMQALISK